MGLELPRVNEPDGKDCDPIKVILIRVWGSQDLEWFYPSMLNAAHAPWDVSDLNMQELLDTRAALTHLHQHVCKTSTQVAFGERKLLASKPKHGSNVDVYLTQGVTEYKRLMVYDLLTKCGAYRDLVEILRRARMVCYAMLDEQSGLLTGRQAC